jgi:hypothetical protein
MPAPPLEEMRIVASRLKPLDVPFAFLGGAVMCLLVDHPELTDFRRASGRPVSNTTRPKGLRFAVGLWMAARWTSCLKHRPTLG